MPRTRYVLTALVALTLLITACSGSSKHKSSAAAPAATSTTAATSTSTTAQPAATTTTAASGATTTAPAKPGVTTPHSSTTRPPLHLRGANITIQNLAYSPSTYTAKPGALVLVANGDKVNHTLTADDGSFDLNPVEPNVNAAFTAPTKPGTYTFHCRIHSSMHGTLIVS